MKIRVKIAKSEEEQQKGLMGVTDLPNDEGMLFDFGYRQNLSFWGMNTYIPLDIAFIQDNKIVRIDKIKPHSLVAVSSFIPCDAALEVNANFFLKNGIGENDTVKIDGEFLEFIK